MAAITRRSAVLSLWAAGVFISLFLSSAVDAQVRPGSDSRVSRGAAVPRSKPPAAAGERVTFETDEKVPVKLVATYWPAGQDEKLARAPIALLLHMYDETRSSFEPLVPALHAAGLAVLALDLRGHGESREPASLKLNEKAEERDPRLFRDMVHDVEAAYRWLSRRPDVDPARFVLVGAGVGGSIALEYAGRDRSVDGVVLMTPGLDYVGHDSRAAAKKIAGRAVLMLTAEEERAAADELARLVRGSRVKIVGPRPAGAHSMALHGTRMLGQAAQVEGEIARFLAEAAGPPSEAPVVASTIGEVYYEPGTSQADRLSPENRRTFSSASEAQARGYRPSKRRGGK